MCRRIICSNLGFPIFLRPPYRWTNYPVNVSFGRVCRRSELRREDSLDKHFYDDNGNVSKAWGKHLFSVGASLNQRLVAAVLWVGRRFRCLPISDGEGNGGDAMASMMLGVPGYAEVDNVYSYLHGGKVISAYFQDQWRVTPRLALNLKVFVITVDDMNPREGQRSNGSDITGDLILQQRNLMSCKIQRRRVSPSQRYAVHSRRNLACPCRGCKKWQDKSGHLRQRRTSHRFCLQRYP